MLSLKLLYDSPLASLLTGWRRRRVGNLVIPAVEDKTLDDDSWRASYVRGIPQAQIFRNVLLQGYLVPADVLIELEDIDIREDDVFIITYPKSGTTWTEEIVSLIFNGGDVSRVEKELLVYRVHHLEVARPLGHLRFLRKQKSPRLMATHLPYPLIPKQLRQAKCKVIYVVRNPKDTAVSYYHHHKMSTFLGNYSGTWDEFLDHFTAGHVVYGSWYDHALPYWKFCNEHPDKVFFISYEELKLDLKGMIRSLSNFLERPLSESSLETICRHCSFEKMKTNQMVNREKLPITDLFDMSKSKFMRKGIIGDWKNYFSPEQAEMFDRLHQEKMSSSTLDLVFEPEDAAKRMTMYGRIIYNHPVAKEIEEGEEYFTKESSDSEDDICTCDSPEDAFCFPWSYIVPAIQIDVQPDPLTFDFI